MFYLRIYESPWKCYLAITNELQDTQVAYHFDGNNLDFIRNVNF